METPGGVVRWGRPAAFNSESPTFSPGPKKTRTIVSFETTTTTPGTQLFLRAVPPKFMGVRTGEAIDRRRVWTAFKDAIVRLLNDPNDAGAKREVESAVATMRTEPSRWQVGMDSIERLLVERASKSGAIPVRVFLHRIWSFEQRTIPL